MPGSPKDKPGELPSGTPAPRGAGLAQELRIELPEFVGPLCAFEVSALADTVAGIYLGGDLHAVHPEAPARRRVPGLDQSLDSATIIVDDLEHESLRAHAHEGIWCVRLSGPMLDSAPYFSLFDADGRLRHWLILPAARKLIGAGHLWLPAVDPASA